MCPSVSEYLLGILVATQSTAARPSVCEYAAQHQSVTLGILSVQDISVASQPSGHNEAGRWKPLEQPWTTTARISPTLMQPPHQTRRPGEGAPPRAIAEPAAAQRR